MTALPQGTGDCYEVAAEFVLREEAEDYDTCHGYPTGQGPIAGIRYGHAWVECNGMVIDKSNGLDVVMPAAIYYAIGKIDPAEVTRYDRFDVLTMMDEYGHYGPWDGSCDPIPREEREE